MENTTMRFDLTSRQIKFRDILKKEFLELEIWAISDINPNRNMTHFTLESMQKALPGMKNKPIVASFNNGDFGSHDGTVDYDKELKNDFWNVENGERILGWIRESDPVEIIEKDGLHWIKFRCAICVTYCYNQVKKLLKDRSKKVSVEITVHDAGFTDEGIEEIYDFTLNGVTILGSKNGKQVTEAIPDAHVSLLEKIDDEVFAEQKRVLTFAYQKMEDGTQKSDKEVKANMEDQLENAVPTCEECDKATVEEDCKCDCGKTEENACGCDEMQQAASEEQCAEPVVESVEEVAVDPEKCEDVKCEDEVCAQNEDPAVCEEKCECDPEKCAEDKSDDDQEDDSDDDQEDDSDDDKDEQDCKFEAQIAELQQKCEQYDIQVADLAKENADLKEKYADYEEIKSRMEAAEAKVHEYFCADLKAQAYEMMAGETINEADRTVIESKCVDGKYTCIDDIKRDVAYAIYNARPAKSGEKYSTVLIPTETVEKQNNKNNTMTREERIAQRNRNGKN